MAKRWKYIEPAVAIAGALIGLPPHAMVGAVGAGKLLAAKLENSETHGLDNEALITSIRAAAFRAADRFDDDAATRDARTDADALLAAHLLSCLPSRATLVTLFRKGEPAQSVADHVADALATYDERFAADAGPVAGFSARDFACAIVRDVIEAALANKDYAQKLLVYLGIETLQGAANLKGRQAEDRRRDIAFQDMVLTRFKALENAQAHDANAEELRGHIIALLKLNEGKSAAELVEDLKDYVAGFEALRAKVDLIEASDSRVAHAKAAAQAALERRDLEAARFHLKKAAQNEIDRASDHVRGAAQSYAARADADLLALDWQAADAAWDQAAAMLMPFDVAAGEAIVEEAGDRLLQFGEIYAQTPALVASERRWRALEAAAHKRGDGERVVTMQNWLGLVVWRQGERAGGDVGLALLAEAVAAYRAALSACTQAAMPVQWAMSQNGLGNVLQAQGERTGGDAGLALLAEAVAAFREALSIRTQAAMPADWASTQNGLGAVLQVQGEWTEGDAGLALLAEAVAAYRVALSVRTQAAMPAQWAMTQHNLGAVLQVQGERTGGDAGLALLAEAVAAFRAALSVYTQAAMPADWAMAQFGLGNVLSDQGERTGGDAGLALLEEAVSAYRAALTILTSEHFSHYHELASDNLAATEAALNARLGGGERP